MVDIDAQVPKFPTRRRRDAGEVRNLAASDSRFDSPNIGERIAGGFLRGLQESDPITRSVFGAFVSAFPDATEDQVTSLIQRTSNSRLADSFAIAGEFAPGFALGAGAFTVGRALAVRGVAALGKQQIAKLGAARALEHQAGRTAARRLINFKDRTAKLGAEFGPGGARSGKLTPVPLAETAAEIGGGGAGIGGLVFAEETIDGAPISDAARAALFASALSFGFDGMLRTAGHMFQRARTVDRNGPDARGLAATLEIMAPVKAEVATEAGKTALALEALQGVRGQVVELMAGRTARLQMRSLRKLADEPVPAFGGIDDIGAATPQRLHRILQQRGVGSRGGAQFKGSELARQIGAPKKLASLDEQIRGKTKNLAAQQGVLKAISRHLEDPVSGYVSGKPWNPSEARAFVADMAMKIITTPESFKGSSRTINKFLEQSEIAFAEISIANAHHSGFIAKMHGEVSNALGFSRKQRKQGKLFLPLFHAWETGAGNGVRDYMASVGRSVKSTEVVVRQLDELDEAFRVAYEPLARIGGSPTLSAEDMRRMGVQKFFPHVFADLNETRLLADLTKSMGPVRAHQVLDGKRVRSIKRFGSIDENRTRKGSLQQKIDVDGDVYLESNPFIAAQRYLDEVSTRHALGRQFGINGELKQPIIDSARREGFNPRVATSLVDVVLTPEYYDQAMRAFSRGVTNFQTGSKLATAVVANMSQPINTATWAGTRNFLRGFALRVKGENKNDLMRAVALTDSVATGVGRFADDSLVEGVSATAGGKLSNTLATYAHWVLKGTGFSLIEGWNRTLSAATGYHMIMDTVSKAAFGRLRGRPLDLARRRMETLGIDLDQTVLKLQRNGDDYLNSQEFKDLTVLGMFRASTATQFNPNPLRRPTLWNHPVGRIMAQFKTFALGQGRFLRDQVFAEAGRGNYKPMAYFLSIYPVAGEVVGDVRAFVKGKDREEFNGIERAVSNMTMVGGVGMLSDLYTSARFGRLAEAVGGPTAGDIFQTAENFVRKNPGAVLGQVERLPIVQVTKSIMTASVLTTAALKEYSDTVLADEPTRENKPVIDMGRLRTSR